MVIALNPHVPQIMSKLSPHLHIFAYDGRFYLQYKVPSPNWHNIRIRF